MRKTTFTTILLLSALAISPIVAQDTPPAAKDDAQTSGTAAYSKTTIRAADNRQFDVWMDGTRLGLTPIEAEIPSGKRMITASAELLSPVIEFVELVPGQSHDIVIPVEPLTNQNYKRITDNVNGGLQMRPKNAHLSLIAAMTTIYPDEGETLLKRADALSPNNPLSKLLHGKRLQVEKKYEESLKVIDEGLKLDPRYAALHRQRAKTLAQMRNFGDAMEPATVAIEIDPNDWQSYYTRGVIHAQTGSIDKARKDYLKALSLSPRNSEVEASLKAIEGK